MFNWTCTTFTFHHGEKMVTNKLKIVILRVKCDFRLESCFSTIMVLLTYFAVAFVCTSAKKKPNKASALKGVSGLPGQCPERKYHLNHFE